LIPGEGKRHLSTPKRPHRLWVPPSLLFNLYQGSVPGDKTVGAWSWALTSVEGRG